MERKLRRALEEYLANNPTDRLVDENWLECSIETAKPMRGASSQVYRVLRSGRLKRALKILMPKKAIADAVSMEVFYQNFAVEALVLSRVTHQNIVKLLDFGKLGDGDELTPFVVTDFIQGEHLDGYFRTANPDDDTLMSVLVQILHGLQFLHAANVLHCDLKPSNIFVDAHDSEEPRAIIADLGVAKVIATDDDQGGDDDDATYLFGTDEYFAPEVKVLSNRFGNKIPRQKLRDNFPHIDMYAFGVNVRKIIGILEQRTVSHRVSPALIAALKTTVRFLTEPADSRYGQIGAQQLRTLYRQLDPASLAPLGIPELAAVPPENDFVTTTQGRVATTKRIQHVRWHPMMWRLHELPQLELAYFVYPAARHSRYLHAINTYQVTRQLMNGLLSDWRTRLWCSRVDIESTLLKALLHDIAHYPLSQVFEDISAVQKRVSVSEAVIESGPLTRDELFSAFCGTEAPSGRAAEIFEIVSKVRDREGRNFAELLDFEFGSEVVNALITRDTSKPNVAVMEGLLSSPIDACKLAYLVDDSIMTGLTFGRSIDVQSIASALRWPSDRQPGQAGTPVLGLAERGVSAAAAAVEARQHLIVKAYWHAANRSIMAMFKHVVLTLMRDSRFSFVDYFTDTLFQDEREATVWLRDKYAAEFPDHVNPLECLMPRASAAGFRGDYARIARIAPDLNAGDEKAYDKLLHLNPFEYHTVYKKLGDALRAVGEPEPRPGELLLDVPFKDRENLGGQVFVYTEDPEPNAHDLLKLAPTLRNLRLNFDRHAKIVRVLMHPDLHARLKDRDVAARAIKDGLHNA